MTDMVIRSGREESFPWRFDSLGERKLMNHFVVKDYHGVPFTASARTDGSMSASALRFLAFGTVGTRESIA
jgi:hypothetical protein